MSLRRSIEIIILFLSGLIIIYLSIPSIDNHLKDEIHGPITVPNLSLNTEYGLILDTLLVKKDKVKRNEFLSDILLRYDVDYVLIDKLVKVSKPVFNVRKIRKGNTYSIIQSKDSLKRTLFFVYENSPTTYVVVDFRDSVNVWKGNKEVNTRTETASGFIKTSLWNAMIDNDTDPNLANELSEIFAWTVDFFGIQKGDHYKVIYEDLYVDDQRIGLGKVLAAHFNHAGHDYFSIYFVQDTVGDYFDENAGSMRRTFLKAPLRFKRISSGFSYNRLHPILKIYRPHTGIDYAAAYGTPVHSVGDGVVTMAGWTKQGGRTVKIKHNGTYSTAYLHLSKYGKGIRKGAQIKQGDIIGYVGKSGLATGPHLDFRFYRNGKPINPLKVESPPAKPVDSLFLGDYFKVRDEMMGQLTVLKIDSIQQ